MMELEMPTLQEVLEESGGNEDLLKELLYKFRLWLKQQIHLPQDISDQRLKYIIYARKFDFEKAKKSLDAIYTLRSLVPEIYSNFDPLSVDINLLHTYLQFVSLPKLTSNKCRVLIGRIINTDISIYNSWIVLRYMVMGLEARIEKDIVCNNILIVDFTDTSLQHILKYTPTQLSVLQSCQEAYCARMKATYIINAPQYIDVLMKMVKLVIKPKLFNRIHVYTSGIESLYETIPKSILPVDYGGEQPSMDTLTDMWKAYLHKIRNWFLLEENRKSDESLREKSTINSNDMFGVSGIFRKLELD